MAVTRPRASKRTPKRWPIGLLLIAVGTAGVWAARTYVGPDDLDRVKRALPVEYVRVEGDVWHLIPDEFRAAVKPRVSSGFVTLDLKAIEAAAEALPWVARAEASRIWPDTVVVRVMEQVPVARWGEDGLLNGQGARFAPPDAATFTELPLLDGPAGREKEVLDMLWALEGKLQSRNLRIASLKLSPRLAWVARTDSGMEIVFGNQDPLAAMDRLLTLIPQLGEGRIASIRKLDLRYPNGFSVVWKPELPAPPDQLG